MHFFPNYYNNTVKYDLINKFWYNKLEKVPRFYKIILNFGLKKSSTKQLSANLLALELISLKKGQFIISKKSNIFLKIRKGYPIGCKLVLQKKLMYHFLTKLIFEIFSRFKTSLEINKKKRKYDYSVSYQFKNSLLFVELEQNYNLFNTVLADLNLTFITNKITQKEFYYLIYSFKQPLKFLLE
jgi:large subunit ribosomal protein L5